MVLPLPRAAASLAPSLRQVARTEGRTLPLKRSGPHAAEEKRKREEAQLWVSLFKKSIRVESYCLSSSGAAGLAQCARAAASRARAFFRLFRSRGLDASSIFFILICS